MYVSVPIRGLFNLRQFTGEVITSDAVAMFPSPSGDYLI